MIKKVIFLFFNICLLGFLFGCNTCNANETQHTADTEIKSPDFAITSFVETPYLDSCNSRGILIESISEQDLTDNSTPQLSLPLNTIAFYTRFSNPTKRSISETNGLLERNIPPVQHVSRNILFHSLLIHF